MGGGAQGAAQQYRGRGGGGEGWAGFTDNYTVASDENFYI